MPSKGHVMVTRSLCRRHHGPSCTDVLSEEEVTLLAARSEGRTPAMDPGLARLAQALLEDRGLV